MALASISEVDSAPECDIEMTEDLEMSLEFGPPRVLPSFDLSKQLTAADPPKPKIKLIGPPKSWLGPPSLGLGLSCPASMYDVNYRLDLNKVRTSSQHNEPSDRVQDVLNGDGIELKPVIKQQISTFSRGKKRKLDFDDTEAKVAKVAKTSRAQKSTKKNAARKNAKKAEKIMKKLSKLSIH